MAFNFGQWLPYLVGGGATVAGALIGSRASGRAAETQAQAAEQNSETQLQLSRDQIKNIRDVYNLDLSLNWPRHRLASESLGRLALGSGSKLPMSAFATTEAPPELPGFGAPGAPGAEGEPPTTDPLDPATGGRFPVPPGGGGGGAAGRTAGGALSGAGTGAAIGSFVPGIGTAIGAGVGAAFGAAGGLFGRGRREADTIVPHQNELVRRTGLVGTELSRRIKDGSITDQDWTDAAGIVRDMRDQFYQFSDQYGRAGPGARSTIDSWFNPMLDAWDNQDANWADDWRSGTYFPNRANLPPSRQFGGPVSRSFSAMSKPTNQQQYLVGEVGEEMYVPQRGAPKLVGRDGPEIFNPPQDGYIVPNNQLPGQQGQQGQTHTLSDLGKNTWGLLSRQEGGPVRRTGGPRPGYLWSPVYGWMTEAEADRIEAEDSEDGGSTEGFWASPDEYHQDNPPPGPPSPPEDPPATPPPGTVAPPGPTTPPGTTPPPRPTEDPVEGFEWFYAGEGRGWLQRYEGGVDPNQPDWIRDPSKLPPEDPGQGLQWKYNDAAGWHRIQGPDYVPDQVAPEGGPQKPTTHPGQGFEWFYNPASGNWDRRAETHPGSSGPPGGGDIRPGEFLDPWPGSFDSGPAPDPFSYAPGEHGYRPFNEQFNYAPGEHGYQPLNERFEFNSDDLMKDPGYKFRLEEGNKAIERNAASRGFLQSGRTMKSLGQYSQGLASQEYGKAYGRALGEFGISQGQSRDAYGRALGEFGVGQGQSRDAYNRELGEWGSRYGMYGDAYNRDWQEYLNDRDEWTNNRNWRFNTLSQLSGI